MTEQEKQSLAGLCRIEIKRCKAAADSNPNMRYMVELMNVALASLTAESGWIKCSDRMPISKMEADAGFESIDVIVTDGLNVGTCECQAGFLPTPWVNFTAYGDISPSRITHWQPLPTPPEE